MIDQTVWLAPKATSYVVVCEECAAEYGYVGARVEGRLELERGHTAVDGAPSLAVAVLTIDRELGRVHDVRERDRLGQGTVDAVQAMKAGLLEIADLFVVNKADRPGARLLAREIEQMVSLSSAEWAPPVHTVVASEGRGVPEVARAAGAHLDWCRGAGRAAWDVRRGDARVRLVLDLVAESARGRATSLLRADPTLERDVRLGRVAATTVARSLG